MTAPAVPRKEPFQVRGAVIGDAVAMCDLSQNAILVSAAGHYTVAQLQAWAARRTVPAHEQMVSTTSAWVAVASADNTIVGFATVALRAVGALERGEIDQLFESLSDCGGRGRIR